jgi:hypothetical protein
MARINLMCKCGWNFFVSELQPGPAATCPSCSAPVALPKRRGAAPTSAPAQAAAVAGKKSYALLGMIFGAIVVVGIVIIVFMMGTTTTQGPGVKASERPSVRNIEKELEKNPAGVPANPAPEGNTFRVEVPKPADPTPVTLPPPPPVAVPKPVKPDHKGIVLRNTMKMNFLGITAEILRFRGMKTEYEAAFQKMVELEKQIEELISELAAEGETQQVPNHLRPGDQILWFYDRSIRELSPPAAAYVLQKWLVSYHAGMMLRTTVQRGSDRTDLTIFCPDRGKDLLELADAHGLLVEPEPVVGTAPVGGLGPPAYTPPTGKLMDIPSEVSKGIQDRFKALPPGYRQFLRADERQRLDTLLEKGKGFHEDLSFLQDTILGDVIPRFEQETAQFRAKVQELEPKVMATASADVIYFKDGGKVEGVIEEETADIVKIRTRFGSVNRQKSDIERIEKGKGAVTEFPAKYKAAAGRIEGLMTLLAWCKEKGLVTHKEFVGYQILTMDPASERVRQELGLPKTPIAAKSPSGGSSFGGDEVSRKMTLLAAEALTRYVKFQDVLQFMQQQTRTIVYPTKIVAPEKYNEVCRIINNPVEFKPYTMHPNTATYFESWWQKLSPDERRDFVKFFGLWCASTRTNMR